jgi:hypothetical protein
MNWIDWTDWTDAAELPQSHRDWLANEVLDSRREALPCHYILQADTLMVAVTLPDGEIRLFDCTVRRVCWDASPQPVGGHDLEQRRTHRG